MYSIIYSGPPQAPFSVSTVGTSGQDIADILTLGNPIDKVLNPSGGFSQPDDVIADIQPVKPRIPLVLILAAVAVLYYGG